MNAQVDEALCIPAALDLHQRPGVPGIRSFCAGGGPLFQPEGAPYKISRFGEH